jgi:hypothetical protein
LKEKSEKSRVVENGRSKKNKNRRVKNIKNNYS